MRPFKRFPVKLSFNQKTLTSLHFSLRKRYQMRCLGPHKKGEPQWPAWCVSLVVLPGLSASVRLCLNPQLQLCFQLQIGDGGWLLSLKSDQNIDQWKSVPQNAEGQIFTTEKSNTIGTTEPVLAPIRHSRDGLSWPPWALSDVSVFTRQQEQLGERTEGCRGGQDFRPGICGAISLAPFAILQSLRPPD